MAGQRITKRVVDSLKTQANEYTVWDGKMPGLAQIVPQVIDFAIEETFRSQSSRAIRH